MKSGLPRFQDKSPIAPCPYCPEGVVQYRYTWDNKDNIIEYVECNEVLCGNMVNGEALEEVLNSEMAIYKDDFNE